MKKVIRLTESDLARIVKRIVMEQNGEVPELERQQYVQKMIDEYIRTMYSKPGSSDVIEDDGSVNRLYATNGVLDVKKVYNFKGDEMAEYMVEIGFPDGFYIPENISRADFDKFKQKWENTMKILKYENK